MTHLSFSAAFSLFTFAAYVRYFALYPFGAAVHVFLNEFLDHKDSGTAILPVVEDDYTRRICFLTWIFVSTATR